MRLRHLGVALFCATAAVVQGQTAPEKIASGDRAAAAFQAAAALTDYEAAVALAPTSYEALWKAAKTAVDLGEGERDPARRKALYDSAQGYAKRAVQVKPNDAEAHFQLARALGRTALSLGARDRVKYAKEIRAEALEALRLDPNHPGALHVMGVWNAEVMRLSGIERFLAKHVLGGRVFDSASWKDAQSYMERAVAVDPDRLTHHLDLGRIYLDVGNKAKAREQFQLVVDGPRTDVNDPLYKREAEAALAKLR